MLICFGFLYLFLCVPTVDTEFDASVGTNVGDVGLWEVGSREKLVLKNFKVWNLGACSMPLQVCRDL